MIRKEDLIVGCTYVGTGRNFNVGVWNGETFLGIRQKFGRFMMDEEIYYEGDYGTFEPDKTLDDLLEPDEDNEAEEELEQLREDVSTALDQARDELYSAISQVEEGISYLEEYI